MKRREFITLLGGATVAWPLAARAQQRDRMRFVGVLFSPAADREAQSWLVVFQEELRKLGWTDVKNIRFDIRPWEWISPRLFYTFNFLTLRRTHVSLGKLRSRG